MWVTWNDSVGKLLQTTQSKIIYNTRHLQLSRVQVKSEGRGLPQNSETDTHGKLTCFERKTILESSESKFSDLDYYFNIFYHYQI